MTSGPTHQATPSPSTSRLQRPRPRPDCLTRRDLAFMLFVDADDHVSPSYKYPTLSLSNPSLNSARAPPGCWPHHLHLRHYRHILGKISANSGHRSTNHRHYHTPRPFANLPDINRTPNNHWSLTTVAADVSPLISVTVLPAHLVHSLSHARAHHPDHLVHPKPPRNEHAVVTRSQPPLSSTPASHHH